MAQRTLRFVSLLVLFSISSCKLRPFPENAVFNTTTYGFFGSEKQILFQGECYYYLENKKEYRYIGECPKSYSTLIGFYKPKNQRIYGGWQSTTPPMYGTFDYNWDGETLTGYFTVYPNVTGYHVYVFVKEVSPPSSLPTM